MNPMVQNALLVLTAPLRTLSHSLNKYLTEVAKTVSKRLYVKLDPNLFGNKLDQTSHLDYRFFSKFVPLFYNRASNCCRHLDVRLLLPSRNATEFPTRRLSVSLDVVISDACDLGNIRNYVSKHFEQCCPSIVHLNPSEEHRNNVVQTLEDEPQETTFDNVILGGTFDRLHNGHKVLLTAAINKANRKLVVGVTDVTILQRKSLWELIDPIDKRIEELISFLKEIDPSIEYSVVPIYDPYGPSIVDKDLDCIVVSDETLKGGNMVNIERAKRNMKPLEMSVVTLVEDPYHTGDEEEKISSSTVRRNLLGTFLKVPEKISHFPVSIALTGSVMSGVPQVVSSLNTLGIKVVDCCNVLAQLSESNDSARQMVMEVLGSSECLMDKSLDSHAFDLTMLANESKREDINTIVFPLFKQYFENELSSVNDDTRPLAVIFVLPTFVQDEWLRMFDQVWVTISPESERMKRLKGQYSELPDKAAEEIVSQLPSNSEFVRKAHVVFSTQWGTEFVDEQVKKAWNLLSVMNGTDNSGHKL